MKKWQTWLVRCLVILACGLIIFSFFRPWWSGVVTDLLGQRQSIVHVYGWGIPNRMTSLSYYLAEDFTPVLLIRLAWVFVGVVTVIAIIGAWLKGLAGSIMILTSGVAYLSYALIAFFVVISNRLETMSVLPIGQSTGYLEGESFNISANLNTGYYMACLAGGILILTGVLRIVLTSINKHN